MENLVFGEGYRPGLIGETIALHMAYYAPAWGFGAPFEAKLAREMGEFHGRFEAARDLAAWAADAHGRLVGAITIDGADAGGEGAHLRWFIVSADVRGCGVGARLMAEAAGFLDRKGLPCFLTTFAGLDPARRLYERHGFALAEEQRSDPWSGTVGLQRFVRPSRPRVHS